MAKLERMSLVTAKFRVRILTVLHAILDFLQCKWHERAIFLHLPKDTCATAIGQPNCLRVLPFHCCASD